MKFESYAHKGLRRLVEDDDVRGLDAQALPKLRRMLAVMDDAATIEELVKFPLWKIHQLTGDRRRTWSISVTRNWRLTFGLSDKGGIVDLNLEDYH